VRTIVKGKNFDVPDRDRRYAEDKLRRLERLLDDRSEAIMELAVEGHRSAEDSHIAEVTLVIDGRTLRGSANGATHKAAIDEVLDKLERRAVDHRERPRERARTSGATRRETVARMAVEEGASGPEGDDSSPRVVKVKRFAIEPMFEEDAVARMEELGHSFFVFVNAENERVAVLYRRRDGDYGLIEPSIGGGYTPREGTTGDASR
jgi:putative sigma-54 modulation protein